jgi:hypothetical protein
MTDDSMSRMITRRQPQNSFSNYIYAKVVKIYHLPKKKVIL